MGRKLGSRRPRIRCVTLSGRRWHSRALWRLPMAARRTGYRFGIFETDLTEGRLRRQGEPVRLQEQPFQILIALLERHGEVVTRDELRKRLWPGDTFVEFDKSLGVALAKLRAALATTRPIRGSSKRCRAGAIDSSRRSPSRTRSSTHSRKRPPTDQCRRPRLRHALPVLLSRCSPRRRGARTSGSTSAPPSSFSGTIAAGALYWRSRVSSAPPAPMSIVIAQFANSTGDTSFDGSLRPCDERGAQAITVSQRGDRREHQRGAPGSGTCAGRSDVAWVGARRLPASAQSRQSSRAAWRAMMRPTSLW